MCALRIPEQGAAAGDSGDGSRDINLQMVKLKKLLLSL
jgi:hypothetical protein